MSVDSITTGGMVVAGVAVIEFVRLGVGKLVNSDYVTRAECAECRQDCRQRSDSDLEELKRDISMIKQTVLIMAAKIGVGEADLRRLVE